MTDYRLGSPQPLGAQDAAEGENPADVFPSMLTADTPFSTCSLPHLGQTAVGGLLTDRTNNSNGSRQSSQ